MTGTSPKDRIVIAVTDPKSLRLLTGLPRLLSDTGWDVHLVLGSPADAPPGCTVHVVPMTRTPSPWADLRSLVRWVRLLRRLRPGLVLAGTPKAGLLCTVAAAAVRVPERIYHLRGLRLETAAGAAGSLYTWLEKLAMRASTHVLAVSPSLVSKCIELGLAPRAKLDVLGAGSSNGVDLEVYAPPSAEQRAAARDALDVPTDRPVVLYVGRMTPDKGLDNLAEAARFLSDGPEYSVVLVGDDERPGYAADIEQRLTATGVPTMHVAGVSEPLPYYHAADVLCLPSLREGFPNVVLEAAACGLPVVTTDATGCRDAVQPEVTGWLSVAGDPVSLSEALLGALEDGGRRAGFGSAGRRWVESEFSRATVQTNIVHYLATLTNSDARPIATKGQVS